MANLHYAEIGDVWKHLLLAEVLVIDAPRRYLESHAGSSSYLLTSSPERDYGALRFASRATRSPTLEGSAYRRPLARYGGRALATYPGSPLIAMTLLGSAAGHAGGTRFVFCDLDANSLSTISEDARTLGLPDDRLRLVEGGGISEINRQLASLSEEEADATFLHADPYQPLAAGEDGATTLDLFGRAATLGAKCMLWYGFDSVRDRDDLRIAMRSLADASRDGGNEEHRPLWYGEVSLRADDLSEGGFDPGVLGCGVLLCNVGEGALAACERLDLNGDDKPDLAATSGGRSDRLSVLTNRGNGTFKRATAYDAGADPGSVTAADFNGDREADLAVANYSEARISLLANLGAGRFGEPVAHQVGRNPTYIAAANLGGTMKPDLAVANLGPSNVSVLVNTTKNRPPAPR